MLPLHRRHKQLLQEAFGHETSSSMEEFNIHGGGNLKENGFSSELNSTATTLANMSMTEKVPPSLRILRWDLKKNFLKFLKS